MSKVMDKVDQFIKDNLVECCTELIQRRDTGILCGGKVREAARMLGEWVSFTDGLGMVEHSVSNLSMEMVINLSMRK